MQEAISQLDEAASELGTLCDTLDEITGEDYFSSVTGSLESAVE